MAAELELVGDEFLVNTTTLGQQDQPSIAALSNGNFVVVWRDDSGVGDSDGGIKAQIFDASGVPVGTEFVVNDPPGQQNDPSVTALAGGGFVVCWSDQFGDSIEARIFDATGASLTNDFVVDSQSGRQDSPSITALASGGFVVCWRDNSGTLGDASDASIKGQIYNSSGFRVGSEFLVNSFTAGPQYFPSIAALEDGGFVVVWEDMSGTLGDADSSSIKAQVYDAAGIRIGAEFLVNTSVEGTQQTPVIAGLSNGNFVVAWINIPDPIDVAAIVVKAQMFDATGEKVGDEFLASTGAANLRDMPSMTALADGRFAITWHEARSAPGSDSSGGIIAQLFEADGSRLGAPILVNSVIEGDQKTPVIAELMNGQIVIAWRDEGSTDLKAQILQITDGQQPNTPPTANADTATALEAGVAAGSAATGNVLSNDTDIDVGDSKTVSAVAFGATTGTVGNALAGAYGSLTLNAAGSFGYAIDNANPTVNALRLASDTLTETFSYTMRDGSGATSTSILTITIQGANDAPMAVDDLGFGFVAGEDHAGLADFHVLANDRDSDLGDSFQILSIDATGMAGNLTIVANGTQLRYEANPAAFQHLNVGQTAHEVATYTIRDQSGATSTAIVRIDIDGRNDAPSNLVLSGDNIDENSLAGALVGTAAAFDVDNSSHTYTLINDAGGRFAIDGATGRLTVASGALLDFEIETGVTLTVRATDPLGAYVERDFTVAINDISEAKSYTGGAGSNTFAVSPTSIDNWTMDGRSGGDILSGGAGRDILIGGAGEDALDGGAGHDILRGGTSFDSMTGGSGRDTFDFNDPAESQVGRKSDLIFDFNALDDLIDLSDIDANQRAQGDQSFSFIGQAQFSRTPGELRYEFGSDGFTHILADLNGDGKADMEIRLTDPIDLTPQMFIL